MIMNKIFPAILAALLLAPSATAQDDLTKEITIATDYTPLERKAAKLNLLPTASKAPAKPRSIGYSQWAEPADVPALAPLLVPYPYRTSHDFSSSRGYVDLGVGSFANIAGSAGYAIVRQPDTDLNLWLQHNSSWTGRNRSENLPAGLTEPLKQKFCDNVVALDFSRRFFPGTLSASVMCHFDRFSYYGGYGFNSQSSSYYPNASGDLIHTPNFHTNGWESSDSMQSVREFRIALGWRNRRSEDFRYSSSLEFSHFGLARAVNATAGNKGISDNHIAISFTGEKDCYGADASVEYLGRSIPEIVAIPGQPKRNDGMGMVTLAPFFRYSHDSFSARVGVNVNLSISDGPALRFAPRVNLAYVGKGFAVELNATGGKRLSLLTDFFALNRYISPTAPLSNPYVPLDAELALRLGPFSGFHASVAAAYGIFNDMPMPVARLDIPQLNYCTEYAPSKLKGVKLAAEVGYRYHSLAEARLKFAYSPHDVEKGYFMGYDRAKCVADFSLSVTPIEPLRVTLGYELRAKRITAASLNSALLLSDLGTVSNLSLGASYRVMKPLCLFASCSNLLGKHWDNFYSLGAQGFTIMVGASYVF